jgi:dCMP deaminase
VYPLSRKWVDHYLLEAYLWSRMSKDPSTCVGAIIVDERRRPISTGYNGLPEQMADHHDVLTDRDKKYPRVVHAEMNTILNAARSVRGGILFSTMPPCGDKCAILVVAAGIKEVHAIWPSREQDERIKCTLGKDLMREGGVRSYWYHPEDVPYLHQMMEIFEGEPGKGVTVQPRQAQMGSSTT